MKKLVKPLVNFARTKISERERLKEESSYKGFDVQNYNVGNNAISEILKSSKSASIGKMGSTELEMVRKHLRNISTDSKEWIDWMHTIHVASGIFPEETTIIKNYCEAYLKALGDLDILGVWFNIGEAALAHQFCRNANFVNYIGLEPYYCENPWSRYLENKNVLVISPFKDSIKLQYDKRDLVWGERKILPDFNLKLIKMPLSDAIVPSVFSNWQEQLDDIKKQMDSIDYDVVIVGAGAYSLLITQYAKLNGKIGIHLGGSTQILFGVNGARWENHPVISKFFNEHWIRPLPQESPETKSLVENGCYW